MPARRKRTICSQVSCPLYLPRCHQQSPFGRDRSQGKHGDLTSYLSISHFRYWTTQTLHPLCRTLHPTLPPAYPAKGLRQDPLLRFLRFQPALGTLDCANTTHKRFRSPICSTSSRFKTRSIFRCAYFSQYALPHLWQAHAIPAFPCSACKVRRSSPLPSAASFRPFPMIMSLSLSLLLIQATVLFRCQASRFFVPAWLYRFPSMHFPIQRISHPVLLAKRTSQAYNHPQHLRSYILLDDSPRLRPLQFPNLR